MLCSLRYLCFSSERLGVVCLGISWRDEDQVQPPCSLFPGRLVEGCSVQALPSPFCQLPPCFSAGMSHPLLKAASWGTFSP